MPNGSFFTLDNESILSEGQVLFRYLPISGGAKNGDLGHPVYITMSSESIEFFFNGLDTSGNHLNTNILHLSLSKNIAVKDELTHTLDFAYKEVFKINGCYKYQYVTNEDDELGCEKRITYWNLIEFKPKEIIDRHKDKITIYENKIIFFRKLLLDFLFDLQHSSVFEASPYYEEVLVRLKENFAFSAIACKAAYYHWRWNYLNNRKRLFEASQEDKTKLLLIQEMYASELSEAERIWLNVIRNDSSLELFSDSGWFEPVESEYSAVMFNADCAKSNNKSKADKYSRAILIDELKNDGRAGERNVKILRETARWYFRRYSFCEGVRAITQCIKSKDKRVLWCLPIIMPLFLLCFNYTTKVMAGKTGPEDNWVSAFGVYILLALAFMPLFIGLYTKKIDLAFASFGLFLPRLLMATSSAWLVFITSEELWKVSYDLRLNPSEFWWVILLLFPVILFMAIEIKNIDSKITAKNIFKRILCVILIGFLQSLIVGIFFTNVTHKRMITRGGFLANSIQNDIMDSDRFDQKSFPVEFNSLKASKVSLDFTGKLNGPIFLSKDFHLKGNLKNSFPTSEELLEGLKEVEYNFLWCRFKLIYEIPLLPFFKLTIFPGMLIHRAIFALFIGIFVQLIFEDKPITEPL